jgi:hypothetical protein
MTNPDPEFDRNITEFKARVKAILAAVDEKNSELMKMTKDAITLIEKGLSTGTVRPEIALESLGTIEAMARKLLKTLHPD